MSSCAITRAVDILHKVLGLGERPFEIVSGDKPFGLATNFDDYKTERQRPQDVPIQGPHFQARKRVAMFVEPSNHQKNAQFDGATLEVACPSGVHGAKREAVPSREILGKPHHCPALASVCTQTYVVHLDLSLPRAEARALSRTIRTKFFRFLISLRKITQACAAFRLFVGYLTSDSGGPQNGPMLMLYAKYGITKGSENRIHRQHDPSDERGR